MAFAFAAYLVPSGDRPGHLRRHPFGSGAGDCPVNRLRWSLAWGASAGGLRGDAGDRPTPGAGPIATVRGLSDIVQVGTAMSHSLALGRDGRVYVWGANGRGELGLGEPSESRKPTMVPGLEDVIAIAAGGSTSLALKRDGTVWAWGASQMGMLGNGARAAADEPGGIAAAPIAVSGIRNARALAAGEGHVVVLLADGTMRAWGFDGYGQTGVGTAGDYHVTPVRIAAPANVTHVHASSYRSFAVTTDGAIWHWGRALPPGDLDRDSRKRPVVLIPPAGSQ